MILYGYLNMTGTPSIQTLHHKIRCQAIGPEKPACSQNPPCLGMSTRGKYPMTSSFSNPGPAHIPSFLSPSSFLLPPFSLLTSPLDGLCLHPLPWTSPCYSTQPPSTHLGCLFRFLFGFLSRSAASRFLRPLPWRRPRYPHQRLALHPRISLTASDSILH